MTAIPAHLSIKTALSPARIETYEEGTAIVPALDGAIALYTWNAKVSAAFLNPLHVCEVVIRNAVAEALEATYGPRWPWNATFEASLPDSFSPAFSARKELINVRNRPRNVSTGKVIADLKFKFWETMFTQRFDTRIWNPLIASVFPYLPTGWAVHEARREIHGALVLLRALRNRIAHHEPIFSRGLLNDLRKTQDLVGYRCPVTCAWMLQNQQVAALIIAKPQ